MIPTPNKAHLENTRVTKRVKMTPEELTRYMDHNGISPRELSEILGVSEQVVKLWRNGGRGFSVTNSRLIKLFIKYPQLLKEF